jgi:hypothetical protein
MVNLQRYAFLHDLLACYRSPLGLLQILHELNELESEALLQGYIFMRDGFGGWKLSLLTIEEQSVFLQIDQNCDVAILTIGEQEVQAVLQRIFAEVEARAAMIRRDMLA